MTKQQHKIKGILFDFDGTLAKTMKLHYLAWQRSLQPYDLSLLEEEYYPLEGMRIQDIAKLFCEKYNLPFTEIAPIMQRKKEWYLRQAFPGVYSQVQDIIAQLKTRNLRLAIVTASTGEQLHGSVPDTFLAQFEVIITGERTERGKPFPDPYLLGLKELQLQPEECIVVENAPLGVKSAKNAGVYCIAVTHTVGKEKLQEADEIIPSIANILQSRRLSE